MTSLFAEDLEIPIIVEEEFVVGCCVRGGYHIYQNQWKAKVGTQLKVAPETRPGAFVEDRYAITMQFEDKTVGHVPKFQKRIEGHYVQT